MTADNEVIEIWEREKENCEIPLCRHPQLQSKFEHMFTFHGIFNPVYEGGAEWQARRGAEWQAREAEAMRAYAGHRSFRQLIDALREI